MYNMLLEARKMTSRDGGENINISGEKKKAKEYQRGGRIISSGRNRR